MGFRFKDGKLYCEGLSVGSIVAEAGQTPLYLYSKFEIREKYEAYANALAGLQSVLSYAVKANGNLYILKLFQEHGCWATLVSGGELRLALTAGFDPQHMIFNGNGKTIPELVMAIEHGIIINIDSEFDIHHIQQIAKEKEKSVSVLIRINPNINPKVHPNISTGLQNSKFGVNQKRIPELLAILKEIPELNLIGVHCHLGSTITDLNIFRETMKIMAIQFEIVREAGFPIKYLNLGGGLGIDYQKTSSDFPTPKDLIAVIQDLLPKRATLIIEPGRSLVGSAGVVICSVIGVKRGDAKNYIVIDASMAELIRPSLYDAYHRIEFTEPVQGKLEIFDVVGPVCESGDFLGKDRKLPKPREGMGVVIFDTGAYGYAMSSNYNARPRPAEYLVDKDQLILIRAPESFDDQLRLF